MLHNPSWDKPKPKAEPTIFALEPLIAWLRTKPPTETYDYAKPAECAAAQYLQACGFTPGQAAIHPIAAFGTVAANGDYITPQPSDENYWLHQVVGFRPFTFGAALDRAIALQTSQAA